jgi:hypothetical protein
VQKEHLDRRSNATKPTKKRSLPKITPIHTGYAWIETDVAKKVFGWRRKKKTCISRESNTGLAETERFSTSGNG